MYFPVKIIIFRGLLNKNAFGSKPKPEPAEPDVEAEVVEPESEKPSDPKLENHKNSNEIFKFIQNQKLTSPIRRKERAGDPWGPKGLPSSVWRVDGRGC